MVNDKVPTTGYEPQHARVEDDPAKPYKSIAATIAPVVAVVVWALTPGSDGGSSITGSEIGMMLTAAGLSGGATFGVRNPKRVKRGQDWERHR